MPRKLNDGELESKIERVADDISSCGLNPDDRRAIAIHMLKWPGKRIYFDQLVPPSIRTRTEPTVGAQIASACLSDAFQPWAAFEIARCMNELVRIPQEIVSRTRLERESARCNRQVSTQ